MSYAFDKDAKDGDVVTLENGVAYQYDEAKDRWLVKDVAGSGSGADWGFPLPGEQNYVSKFGGDDMEGPLEIRDGPLKVDEIEEQTEGAGVTHKHTEFFETGLQLRTPNGDATDSNHPDYSWHSKYPLSVKDAQFVTRFGVDVSDGNGPYAWNEYQKPFQGLEDRNLATIGLLKDKAVTYYPATIPSLGELNLKIFGSVDENKDVGLSEAHIDSAYTRLVLNHDPIGAGAGIGRVDWLDKFPDTSEMFIQQGDDVYKLNVTADGAKGSNDRAKHFIINSHEIGRASCRERV